MKRGRDASRVRRVLGRLKQLDRQRFVGAGVFHSVDLGWPGGAALFIMIQRAIEQVGRKNLVDGLSSPERHGNNIKYRHHIRDLHRRYSESCLDVKKEKVRTHQVGIQKSSPVQQPISPRRGERGQRPSKLSSNGV